MEKTCLNCNNIFIIPDYRANTAKFCSYRCSATQRKRIEYASKRELIIKKCELCGADFSVQNMSRYNNKKTCSKDCRNSLQSRHLINYPKAHFKPLEKRVPPLIKTCIVCEVEFKIKSGHNKRQLCCSRGCGAKLAGSHRASKIDRQLFIDSIEQTNDTFSLCDKLGVSLYTIMRLSKKYMIPYKKNNLGTKVRSDGYHPYKSSKNHRKIYEAFYNVKLLPHQGIHHLDGDKLNNDILNLILCQNVSEHAKMHGSLQRVAFMLFKSGLIYFDLEKREYALKKVKGK